MLRQWIITFKFTERVGTEPNPDFKPPITRDNCPNRGVYKTSWIVAIEPLPISDGAHCQIGPSYKSFEEAKKAAIQEGKNRALSIHHYDS